MSQNRNATIMSTWGSADSTVSTGAAYFHGIQALGSAAAGTITVKDGAANKLVLAVSTTASVSVLLCNPSIFSTSLIIDNTGTASYSIIYSKV